MSGYWERPLMHLLMLFARPPQSLSVPDVLPLPPLGVDAAHPVMSAANMLATTTLIHVFRTMPVR